MDCRDNSRSGGEHIRILVVEDEPELARRIGAILEEAGFVVDIARDGDEARHQGQVNQYDGVVLDLGLPGMSGLDVLKLWRGAGRDLPVLILTARTGWVERVNGLNAGADDYLEKPFQAQELVARMRSLTRRAAGLSSPVLRHGDILLNTATGSVTLAGREVPLTAQELRVLSYLMHRQGRVVSQSELVDHVYTGNDERDANTMEVYVSRLRKKLGADLVRTVRGLGYKLG